MAKKQFKAESKRLLDLMINSIYTHKEIFLREIISNASDAIDKLCYASLTDDKVGMERSDFRIRVTVDKDSRILTVSDNGIGMTKDELEANLGVIAQSGSLKFKGEMDNSADEDINIIGQFGVGFYSAFMVADKVTVISRAYGSETGAKWESTGADGYTVADYEKDSVGTDIIMEIKSDTEEENYSEFLESFRLQGLVKKYSDYVRWPIVMDVTRSQAVETDEKDDEGNPKKDYIQVTEEQTINSMIPIWQRSKAEVSDDDCKEFYKEKFMDYTDPVRVIRINAEGAVSYKAMLFIPQNAPYDFYSRDFEPGLQLYSNGVLIMDKCADLLPDHFRFVKGIVDSPDLSLNISRELLQHDRQLRVIASNLEKKIKSDLEKLLKDDRDKYSEFYKNFGLSLKYGIVAEYGMKKDFLKDLIMFYSSGDEKLITLEEYANKMPEEQHNIYYACAESVGRAAALPQTEQVKEKGFEILYLTEQLDEFVIQTLGSYNEKKFCNVSTDDLGLESEEEKSETKELSEENKELLDFIKETLGEGISSVKMSNKLKSHAVFLGTEGEITLEMEKYFKSLPGADNNPMPVKAQRVLEINGKHPAFEALKAAYESDKEKAAKMSKILLSQAMLIADMPLENPSEYTELVCSLF